MHLQDLVVWSDGSVRASLVGVRSWRLGSRRRFDIKGDTLYSLALYWCYHRYEYSFMIQSSYLLKQIKIFGIKTVVRKQTVFNKSKRNLIFCLYYLNWTIVVHIIVHYILIGSRWLDHVHPHPILIQCILRLLFTIRQQLLCCCYRGAPLMLR